jgi:hypothetical protein
VIEGLPVWTGDLIVFGLPALVHTPPSRGILQDPRLTNMERRLDYVNVNQSAVFQYYLTSI